MKTGNVYTYNWYIEILLDILKQQVSTLMKSSNKSLRPVLYCDYASTDFIDMRSKNLFTGFMLGY